MKCVFWLALVAVVALSVLPERIEAKQSLSDNKERSKFEYDESHLVGDDDRNDEDENFDRNSDSDVDGTEKENEADMKDDKDDDAGEESEKVGKVDENQRESGVGNQRDDGKYDGENEDNMGAVDEEDSEDSKSVVLLGDEEEEDDDGEQRMSLFDGLLDVKDYINDNFLAKEGYQYDEDDFYGDVQEEGGEDVFGKDKDEPKNEEVVENDDEDYYVVEGDDDDDNDDDDEEVVEEEWTGTNLRNNNQNDLQEEKKNGHLSELKDGNLGTVSGREEIYFGTSNSVVIGVIVGAVFLAGLLIGLALMVVTYRLLAKSRGFVRLSKHDEFSSQTPIYKKASSPKSDVVSV